MTLSVFATKDMSYTPGYVFQLINREFDAAFLCQGTELFRRLGSFDLLLLLGGKGGKDTSTPNPFFSQTTRLRSMS